MSAIEVYSTCRITADATSQPELDRLATAQTVVTGAAATKPPPPVIFVRVQVSHISCGGDALKLSELLIFTRIKHVAPTDKKRK